MIGDNYAMTLPIALHDPRLTAGKTLRPRLRTDTDTDTGAGNASERGRLTLQASILSTRPATGCTLPGYMSGMGQQP